MKEPFGDIPLFDSISDTDLQTMLACIPNYRRRYTKGEVIIMEQDAIQYTGIILSGTVHMMKEDIWGNQTLVSYMHETDLMGEIFAVQKRQDSYVSFVAATDVTILFIATQNIIHTCPNQCAFHQQLTRNLFDLLGRKATRLMEKIEVTSKPSLREKIMAYLSLQAQRQDSHYFTVPLGRSEMANYLGANRSALTRELAAMQADGIIDFDRNTFRILAD